MRVDLSTGCVKGDGKQDRKSVCSFAVFILLFRSEAFEEGASDTFTVSKM